MANVNYTANAQADLPRTSVGSAFAQVQRPSDQFLKAVRADFHVSNAQPLGMQNPGALCYRNSVLTMLLSSRRFVSYIQNWHIHEDMLIHDRLLTEQVERKDSKPNGEPDIRRQVTAKFTDLLVNDMLKTLNDISRGLNSQLVSGAPGANWPLTTTAQARLDGLVRKFWLQFCEPRGTALGPETGYQSDTEDKSRHLVRHTQTERWDMNRTMKHQQDANEFLVWMVGAISEQLDTYSSNYVKNNQKENFNSLIQIRLSERLVCSKCKFQVRRRRTETTLSYCLDVTFLDSQWDKTLDELKQVDTLHGILNTAFRETQEKRKCPRCNTSSDIEKYLTMRNTPEVLLVKINRNLFRDSLQKKNMQAIDVPEVLEMTDWLEHSDFQAGSVAKYRLSGVVSHRGQSVTSGHYVSYIREANRLRSWYEVNDKDVELCTLGDFNDSQAANISNADDFNNRFTPYILLYELDTKLSRTMPGGRILMNIDEGEDADIAPTKYMAGKGKRTETVDDFPTEDDGDYSKAMIGEDDQPGAIVNATITIDDEKFIFPRQFIKHFDKDKSRYVEFEASITAPTGRSNLKRQRLDLMKAYVDAERYRRKGKKRRTLKNPAGWSKRWKDL